MIKENQIVCTEVQAGIKQLADNSIHCVVTSPPYYNQRDYGVKGQLGNEPTFELYLNKLVNVFVQLKPKLKQSATIWVNIGEKYNGGGMGTTGKHTYLEGKREKPIHQKDIEKGSQMAIPERFKIKMIDAGFLCKNTIIWHKPNAIHGGGADKKKFTNDFEYLYFFVLNSDYYFEQQFEPLKESTLQRASRNSNSAKLTGKISYGLTPKKMEKMYKKIRNGEYDGRNMRTVWNIATKAYHGAHFAVFPEELIEVPIQSGCPKNGIVLDPFMGSGTTAVVAKKLDRRFIGFDINPKYVNLAQKRVNESLFGLKPELFKDAQRWHKEQKQISKLLLKELDLLK